MALIDLQPREFECTPSSLLDSVPCLKCLSEKELLAGILAIFLTELEEDVETVMADSSCFTCMSRKQMLQSLATILGNGILGSDFEPGELLERYKCLRCASDQQLLAAILYLLCLFLNQGN